MNKNQIELKFCHGEKSFSGVSNKFPKSNFQKNVGNLGEQTDRRTDTTENLQFKVTLLVRIDKFFARMLFRHAKNARKWTFFQPAQRGRAVVRLGAALHHELEGHRVAGDREA